MPDDPLPYDVAIIGGGFAGAAMAILLKQRRPELRVVVLDRTSGSHRGIGEALPEVAAFFVGRVLGLSAHLNECHYTRQGARFWFANGDPVQPFDACSEIGGKYLSRLPTFLVDRTVLDAEMLRRAAELGAEVRRATTVSRVDLAPGGIQTLILDSGEEVRARWAVDASGAASALIARQQGFHWPMAGHPTKIAWSRWRGVKDWDSMELRRAYPSWAAAAFGMRNPAINHLTGDGWWSGWTPVRGGEVSIRTVCDARLADVSADPAGMKNFLEERHPAAREMLQEATFVEGSAGVQVGLAFQAGELSGDGFALVGGAAGFIDPLYGGHLDWTANTVMAAAGLILNGRAEVAPTSWFDAFYRDAYQSIGEFDLMRVAQIFRYGMYMLCVARGPYRDGAHRLKEPPIVGLVNRRCARMAEVRRARGRLGRSNAGRRALYTSFNFNRGSAAPLLGAAARWLWLEVTEGWRSWGKP